MICKVVKVKDKVLNIKVINGVMDVIFKVSKVKDNSNFDYINNVWDEIINLYVYDIVKNYNVNHMNKNYSDDEVKVKLVVLVYVIMVINVIDVINNNKEVEVVLYEVDVVNLEDEVKGVVYYKVVNNIIKVEILYEDKEVKVEINIVIKNLIVV